MPEPQIVINASEILRVIDFPRERNNPYETFEKQFMVLRYMMGDTTPSGPVLEELLAQIESLRASWRDINSWRQEVMATLDQMNAAVTKLSDATTQVGTAITSVGARITALEDTIKNMGLTQEQEDAILAQLGGVGDTLKTAADSLTAMGTTPTEPVPVEPPPPVEPVPTEPPANPTGRRP